MAITEKRKESMMQYAKKNLKRIPLDVKLEYYDRIKAHAATRNESVNGFIKRAIDEAIERDKSPASTGSPTEAVTEKGGILTPVHRGWTKEDRENRKQTDKAVAELFDRNRTITLTADMFKADIRWNGKAYVDLLSRSIERYREVVNDGNRQDVIAEVNKIIRAIEQLVQHSIDNQDA